MKMDRNALAVLTLGPKMCKDKFMQAAGRMRQLEAGQKIHIVAQDDVDDSIQALNTQEEQEKKWIYPLIVNSNPSLKQLGQHLLTAMDPEEYVITTLEQTK
jgi:hypothetical protein